MSEKKCIGCGCAKVLAEFYRHNAMRDGHLNYCKTCVKARVKAARKSNLERCRAYDRSRGNRRTAEDQRRYRSRNPEKSRAHSAVQRAVRVGRLQSQPCERCGATANVHAHHEDYSKPLDVLWLCPAHHKERHQEIELASDEVKSA